MMDEESRKAKAFMIDVYFEDLTERVDFLGELWSGGKQDEALTLCCCYLDGMANHTYLEGEQSAHNFAAILMEFGGEPSLRLHTALSLVRWVEKAARRGHASVGPLLRAIPEAELREMRTPEDFESFIAQRLGHNEFGKIKGDLWRGSVAFIAYTHLRNPFVHNFAGSGAVEIGPEGSVDRVVVGFPTLYKALRRILDVMRARSVAEVKWFGHDLKKT